MRKIIFILLIALALIGVGYAGAQTRLAQVICDYSERGNSFSLTNCVFVDRPTPTEGPRATRTPTSIPEPTNTPTGVPEPSATPTVVITPTATVVVTPTATNTPEPQPEGYCPDIGAAHDPNLFHELYDTERDCWYDHPHGSNLAGTFFDGRAEWSGIAVLRPTTPGENALPPDGKHKGFSNWYTSSFGHGIGEMVCQIHTLGSNRAMLARFHSFACGYEVGGGYFYVSGIIDYGIVHAPYKTDYIPTMNDPVAFGSPGCAFDDLKGHPPYRSTNLVSQEADVRVRGRNLQQWNSQIQPVVAGCYEEPSHAIQISLDFFTHDAWDLADPTNPCWITGCYPDEPLLGGHFNSSLHRVYNAIITVPDWGNGVHFADGKGNPNPTCSAVGPDCFMVIIEGAQSGSYGGDNGAGFSTFDPANPANMWVDGDVCVDGSGAEVPCYQSGAESVGFITFQ